MHNGTLNLTVAYPAARGPYQDGDAPSTDTLAAVKARALEAFGLTEGTSPDGTVTTYRLYHNKDALDDLTRTLGSIAGHAHALQLKLAQQIVQG